MTRSIKVSWSVFLLLVGMSALPSNASAHSSEAQDLAPTFQEISILFEPQARCLVWGANGRLFPAPVPEPTPKEMMSFLEETGQDVRSTCEAFNKEGLDTFLGQSKFADSASYLKEFGQALARVFAEIELEPAVDGQGAEGVLWFNQAVQFLSIGYLPCMEAGLIKATPDDLADRKTAWHTTKQIDSDCLSERQDATASKPFPSVDFVSGDWDPKHTKNQSNHRERLRDWLQLLVAYHAGIKGERPFKFVRFKKMPIPEAEE